MNPGMKSGTSSCIRNDDCRGCQRCLERHCAVCEKEHLEAEPRTCIGCLGRARNDLAVITDRLALGEELLQNWWAPVSPGTPSDGGRSNESPLPGGDLLVMVGPGSWALSNPARDLDERASDPEAIIYELTKWEDDWRRTLGLPAAPYTRDLSNAHKFLDHRMGWAAQNLPAFPEFAKLLRGWRARLAGAVRDSDQPTRGVHCQDCPDITLVRGLQDARPCKHSQPTFKPLGPLTELPDGTFRYTTATDRRANYEAHQAAITAYLVDHQQCDQGGFATEWTCPRCHRTYTAAEYNLAVRAQYDQRRADMDAKKTRLEAATTTYVATSNALISVRGAAPVELVDPTRGAYFDGWFLPPNYQEIVEAHRAACLEYAEALTANGYAVPVGLIPDEAA